MPIPVLGAKPHLRVHHCLVSPYLVMVAHFLISTEPAGGDDDKPGLARSKTTLNVPANARELTAPRSAGAADAPPRSAPPTSVTRGPSIGQPVRGLSVRRPSPTEPTAPVPPPPAKGIVILVNVTCQPC